MSTLFHFGFEILKIGIQSFLYLSIIKLLLVGLSKIIGGKQPVLVKPKRIYFLIAGLLLIFSFTYYGDHGLGDEAIIPIGHFKVVRSVDDNAYITTNVESMIKIDSFLIRDNHICFVSEGDYYVYQLTTNKLNKYDDRYKYEAYALSHELPLVNEFKTFYPQYAAYWNGWRFWLLP